MLATTADGRELLRYGDDLAVQGLSGNVEAMALYAGQSSGLVRKVEPAEVITRDLAEEANRVLRRFRQLPDD